MVFIFLFISPSSMLSFLLFVLFLLFLLRVWWKAEVLFHTVVVVVYAVRDQNNGPSREGWHIVTTGDLNCRFQSVTVTVQQGDAELLLTESTDMEHNKSKDKCLSYLTNLILTLKVDH